MYFGFSQKQDWLDEFFFKDHGFVKYRDFSYLIRNIFTLSYGQTAEEHGFNHNNYVLQPNMAHNTVFSKWLRKDHMLAHGLKLHTMEIAKPIINSFKAPHRQYYIHLEEEKKLKFRRSLVLNTSLRPGDEILPAHLTSKRPGTGISPDLAHLVIGRTVKTGMNEDDVLRWENIT